MAAYTHEVKYPVVNPDPAVADTVANFNLTDISYLVGYTALGYAFCYAGGEYSSFVLVI